MKPFYIPMLAVFLVKAEASERFKDVDLWLPKTYQNQYVKLLDAADKAKADPYCHKLLSGRLMESKSTLDHLVFHFRCRAENKRSFSIRVDSKTLAVTNEYGEKQRAIEAAKRAEEERIEAEKAAETVRLEQEELEALREEQSHYWKICRTEMKKRLKLFEGIEILSKIPPEPVIDGRVFKYIVDFDAQSQSKRKIHFRIFCEIKGLEEYKVFVKARKSTK
jgi:hypothetical protein